ncbi:MULTISPECIES: hypothetical protein [Nostocales]|uniref:Uncharacterized protein n=1 Tax=Dolichospermum flos-aquae UHCC 0037 TaxID=2590026 RepID=A0ACC7SB31_DOLFA|nr:MULTISPECIES: hypothetical protein [Nostocales]MBO1065038.1 hypothetical protein [Anabaena sp. 54]MTJ45685.1 hypothetical protein [Dolichospermum flos-aquae UHCC 0037]
MPLAFCLAITTIFNAHLLSAEGHATGTECKIEYAPVDSERVVLTFLSEAEIQEQAVFLCQQLGFNTVENIHKPDVVDLLHQGCTAIIQQEGGESKSELRSLCQRKSQIL